MDDRNTEFHIDLGNVAPLKDLSHGWTAISKTSTVIVFIDNNATHYAVVHFTKNRFFAFGFAGIEISFVTLYL